MKAAKHLGIPSCQSPLSAEELLEADEVFLTNSLIGLLPVSIIENHPLNRGTLWKELSAAIEYPQAP